MDQGGTAEVAVMTEPGVDVGRLVMARLGDSYRLATAILLDDGEAEDAVQAASLAAWRRRASLRDSARFGAWFDRILVNQCRDQLRRRRRAVPLAPPRLIGEPAADPPETGMDPDLDAAIARLDIDQRIVVVMRYWQDRTVDDIADRVGIPAGTVKSRLQAEAAALREGGSGSAVESAALEPLLLGIGRWTMTWTVVLSGTFPGTCTGSPFGSPPVSPCASVAGSELVVLDAATGGFISSAAPAP